MRKRPVQLPPIPSDKRYFPIGEASKLCGVEAYVLRFWEEEFHQLRPMTRRGRRRYYSHEDIELVRTIRSLLYDQGFTIPGARNQLKGRRTKGLEQPTVQEEEAEEFQTHIDVVSSRPVIQEMIAELNGLLEKIS